jgi:fatty acid desaturase
MHNGSFRESFEKGRTNARIRTGGQFVFRAFLLLACVGFALVVPVAWYWQIAIFLALRFAVGFVHEAFALHRERREAAKGGPTQ